MFVLKTPRLAGIFSALRKDAHLTNLNPMAEIIFIGTNWYSH
jgi:hypothetical protein